MNASAPTRPFFYGVLLIAGLVSALFTTALAHAWHADSPEAALTPD